MPGHTGVGTCCGPWKAWPSKCSGIEVSPRLLVTRLSQRRGIQLWRSSGRPPLPMEGSGWDHSRPVRTMLGGPGPQPAARSMARAQRLLSTEAAGALGAALGGSGLGLGLGGTQCDRRCTELQEGNILCSLPGKRRSGKKIKLRSHRIYFHISKSCFYV